MATEVLARSMRPQRLSELIGQDKAVARIRGQVASGRLPRTWLLRGESGSGKTTLARIIALSLQLPLERFGEPTDEELTSFKNYDIHEINAAKVNKVEDMREKTDLALHRPLNGRVRVFLLDECHKLTTAAQDLLLKVTEDTPEYTAWILGTTDPGKLLPTLVRRCYQVSMSGLMDADLKKLVIRAKKKAGSDLQVTPLVDQLSLMGFSSPGLVLVAAEQYFGGATPLEACTSSVANSVDGVNPIEICREFLKGDWTAMRELLKRTTADEARGVRLMLLSYLKTVLMSNGAGRMPQAVAQAIVSIASQPPPENPAFLAWFCAVLQLEAKRLRDAKGNA